jgi:hypothetical protein
MMSAVLHEKLRRISSNIYGDVHIIICCGCFWCIDMHTPRVTSNTLKF